MASKGGFTLYSLQPIAGHDRSIFLLASFCDKVCFYDTCRDSSPGPDWCGETAGRNSTGDRRHPSSFPGLEAGERDVGASIDSGRSEASSPQAHDVSRSEEGRQFGAEEAMGRVEEEKRKGGRIAPRLDLKSEPPATHEVSGGLPLSVRSSRSFERCRPAPPDTGRHLALSECR